MSQTSFSVKHYFFIIKLTRCCSKKYRANQQVLFRESHFSRSKLNSESECAVAASTQQRTASKFVSLFSTSESSTRYHFFTGHKK